MDEAVTSSKVRLVINGSVGGYEKLKALSPEELSKLLGVKVTKIEKVKDEWDERAEEEQAMDLYTKGLEGS